jgi:hypothetical protein
MRVNYFNYFFWVTLVASFPFCQVKAAGAAKPSPAQNTARFLYQRLAGRPLTLGSSNEVTMTGLIEKGEIASAAAIATEDDAFIDVTARHFGSILLTSGQQGNVALNDSLALVAGALRDNLDARTLLTGDYSYGADPRTGYSRPSVNSNDLFQNIEGSGRSFSKLLRSYTPQWINSSENAGVLTTRWWAEINYKAGTNRRVVPAVFSSFLCRPIETWKRPNLPSTRIRQDIDRFPQNDAQLFQRECRSCHAPMDGLSGAFSKIDFANGSILWNTEVNPKFLRNSNVYPDGFVTTDTGWVNPLVDDVGDTFGWSGISAGNGLSSFAEMLTRSRAFGECITKRAIAEVCHRDLAVTSSFVQSAAKDFVTNGYKLKDLFIAVAISPACRQSTGHPANVRDVNFRAANSRMKQ